MMSHSNNKTDNETLITNELDEDTVVRPEEGSITAAESSKCVLCGSGCMLGLRMVPRLAPVA